MMMLVTCVVGLVAIASFFSFLSSSSRSGVNAVVSSFATRSASWLLNRRH